MSYDAYEGESDSCQNSVRDGDDTLSTEYEPESLTELVCYDGSFIIEKSKIPSLNPLQKALNLLAF